MMNSPPAHAALLAAASGLARYGGLRTPSETLALTWGDGNWEKSRINVPQPKMATRGKPSRVVPIFPELLPHLQAAFDEAEPGALHLITRDRDAGCNLRTQLLRLIARAGIAPWPKLFQNMRSTRQTELTAVFPAHVVCAWIGNTVDVANAHYLQTTDAHFAKAIEGKAEAAGEAKQKPKHDTTAAEAIRQQAEEENREFAAYAGVDGRMEVSECARQESNL